VEVDTEPNHLNIWKQKKVTMHLLNSNKNTTYKYLRGGGGRGKID
jgi:hypothetical protein